MGQFQELLLRLTETENEENLLARHHGNLARLHGNAKRPLNVDWP